MKKIGIVILHYKNLQDTIDCIDSLNHLKKGESSFSIFVVNNDHTKVLYEKDLGKNNLDVHITNASRNLGFAGGQNLGIKKAMQWGADYILLLNNDTLVDPDLIQELKSGLEKEQSIGVSVPKIYFAKGQEYHKDRYKKEDLGKVIWYAGGSMDWANVMGKHRGVDEVDHGQYDKNEYITFATGCCMLVKREVFEIVGYFDERYFLYFEDSEFCERILQTGFKILYVPSATVWHKNAGAGGGSGSELQDYYMSRNRLLFGFQYAPFRTKIALLKESIRLFFLGRQEQKKGIRDFFIRKFGQGSFSTKS